MTQALIDAVKTGRSLAKGSRAQNIIYSGLLATIVAYEQHSTIARALLCYLLIMILYAVATNFNNISDLQTDRLNKRKDNPYINSSTLKLKAFRPFIYLCLICVVLIQFGMEQPQTIIITLLYLALSYTYSDSFFKIKSKGLLGTILLCVCYGSLPLLLGLYQGVSIKSTLLVELAIFTGFSILPLVLAKDYKDYKGDVLTQKVTPLIQFGSKRLYKLSITISLLVVFSYFVIGIKYSSNELIIIFVSVVYLLLIRKLHKESGKISTTYRNALTLILILMPISILRS